jgi:hypothetical protein
MKGAQAPTMLTAGVASPHPCAASAVSSGKTCQHTARGRAGGIMKRVSFTLVNLDQDIVDVTREIDDTTVIIVATSVAGLIALAAERGRERERH